MPVRWRCSNRAQGRVEDCSAAAARSGPILGPGAQFRDSVHGFRQNHCETTTHPVIEFEDLRHREHEDSALPGCRRVHMDRRASLPRESARRWRGYACSEHGRLHASPPLTHKRGRLSAFPGTHQLITASSATSPAHTCRVHSRCLHAWSIDCPRPPHHLAATASEP